LRNVATSEVNALDDEGAVYRRGGGGLRRAVGRRAAFARAVFRAVGRAVEAGDFAFVPDEPAEPFCPEAEREPSASVPAARHNMARRRALNRRWSKEITNVRRGNWRSGHRKHDADPERQRQGL
jgi:hypothetical protein